MRNTWSGTVSLIVNCDGCGWQYEGKNGLGLAAQHHDRYGHSIHVDIYTVVSYLNDADHAARTVDKNEGK